MTHSQQSLRDYVELRTHGQPPDRTVLNGDESKWSGYMLGVEEAIRAAEAWVAEDAGE